MRRIYPQLNINEKINLKSHEDKLGDKYGSKPFNWQAMQIPTITEYTYVWEFMTKSPFLNNI